MSQRPTTGSVLRQLGVGWVLQPSSFRQSPIHPIHPPTHPEVVERARRRRGIVRVSDERGNPTPVPLGAWAVHVGTLTGRALIEFLWVVLCAVLLW